MRGFLQFNEAVPALSRVAIIFDPATPSHVPSLKAAEAAKLGLRIQTVPVRSEKEYESAFSSIDAGWSFSTLRLSANPPFG